MGLLPAFYVFNLIFCAAIALPTTDIPKEFWINEPADDTQQVLSFDTNLDLQHTEDVQRPELFEYKIVNDSTDDHNNSAVTSNSTTSIKQINGTTIIKNETFVTQNTDSGHIVWHLQVTETRRNEQKSTTELTTSTTTIPITTAATAASTTTSTQTPELKINFIPNIQRDIESDYSPEDIDNRQDNEFFDDIDGLETFEHNNRNNDNSLYQHPEFLPNLEPFEYVYNSQSTEYYANHNNDHQNLNVDDEQFPIDLSNDIAINQKLFNEGAAIHPDAEIFSIDSSDEHQRLIRQYPTFKDIK